MYSNYHSAERQTTHQCPIVSTSLKKSDTAPCLRTIRVFFFPYKNAALFTEQRLCLSCSSLPEVTLVFLTPVKRIRWRRTRRPHHVTHQMLRQRDEEPRVESYREPQISRLFRSGAPGERGTGASEPTHSSLLDTQIISDPDSYEELKM